MRRNAVTERVYLAVPQDLNPHVVEAAIEQQLREGEADGRSAAKSVARSVVVLPTSARRWVDAMRGRRVRVTSVVAYPLGLSKPTIKAIEATSLAKDGVDAIEVTPLPLHVAEGDSAALCEELREIVRGARAARPTLAIDVRVDAAWVRDGQLPGLLDAVRRSGCDRLILDRAGHRTMLTIDPQAAAAG